MAETSITPVDLDRIAELMRRESGVVLDQSKAYLLESRLQPVLRLLGLQDYASLWRAASGTDARARFLLVDALSTHETSFFRDSKPFDLLRHKLIPDMLANDPRRSVRIWSAACSSGQEAYSIAISLKEILFDLTEYHVQVIGTDISDGSVGLASKGEYSSFEVNRGLTPDHLRKHFDDLGNGRFKIKDELRSVASFRRSNLLQMDLMLGRFDIIFCRNVAIYFGKEDRDRLFLRLSQSLNPGGALIVGSTESLLDIPHLYRRNEFHGAVYYEPVR
jgi:chemotaxis protein methyltransferase CheR